MHTYTTAKSMCTRGCICMHKCVRTYHSHTQECDGSKRTRPQYQSQFQSPVLFRFQIGGRAGWEKAEWHATAAASRWTVRFGPACVRKAHEIELQLSEWMSEWVVSDAAERGVWGAAKGLPRGLRARAERCEPQMNAMLAAILSGSTYARTYRCTGVVLVYVFRPVCKVH